jgi:hypothetical protein
VRHLVAQLRVCDRRAGGGHYCGALSFATSTPAESCDPLPAGPVDGALEEMRIQTQVWMELVKIELLPFRIVEGGRGLVEPLR